MFRKIINPILFLPLALSINSLKVLSSERINYVDKALEEITIKPLGETMTSRVAAGDSDGGTTTTTITNGPRGTDSGADSDTDM